jgi:hypothetical protein
MRMQQQRYFFYEIVTCKCYKINSVQNRVMLCIIVLQSMSIGYSIPSAEPYLYQICTDRFFDQKQKHVYGVQNVTYST